MAHNPNYMDTAHAATLPVRGNNQKLAKDGLALGMQSASAASFTNYQVPSKEGKLLPAIPKNLALKWWIKEGKAPNQIKKPLFPPRIAVMYQMKDSSGRYIQDYKGRDKKYAHEIDIKFDEYPEPIDYSRLCEDICEKEKEYLNPAFISRQQVRELLEKLHEHHRRNKENIQPNNGGAAQPAGKGRKKNFFERKGRFEGNPATDSSEDEDAKKKQETKTEDIELHFVEEQVVSMASAKPNKPQEVRSAAPKQAKNQIQQQKQAEVKEEQSDKFNEDDWGLSDKKEPAKPQADPQEAHLNNMIDFHAVDDSENKDEDGGTLEDLINNFGIPVEGKRSADKFGQSINAGVLKQSKKEFTQDDLHGLHDDQEEPATQNQFAGLNKKNLELDMQAIGENDDFDEQNAAAIQQMNDNLIEKDKRQAQAQSAPDDEELLSEFENMPEAEILASFDELYNEDQQLRVILGEYPERYTVPEKISILNAYKKGGGVQGLADIIEDDDDEEQPAAAPKYGEEELEDEGEELDIDLDNPEDVKVIHDEFKKLYDQDQQFRQSFGEEALELGPLQKYQIIEAYNKNGMEAVMNLLQHSADQSGIMQQLGEDGNAIGEGDDEDDIVWKDGKKYNRVQIEGTPDQEYLMDEQTGDIFKLDFTYFTNMRDNIIVEDD